jgi:hypothetical protein
MEGVLERRICCEACVDVFDRVQGTRGLVRQRQRLIDLIQGSVVVGDTTCLLATGNDQGIIKKKDRSCRQ